MTVRTTLSFTDRHHRFIARKVREGVFASASAAVASAVEAMIEDEAAREAALGAMADEIRARLATTADDDRPLEEVLAEARSRIAHSGEAQGGAASRD
jgi:Arc/MetJ-type ribon-helix-helix transcriptional regulator